MWYRDFEWYRQTAAADADALRAFRKPLPADLRPHALYCLEEQAGTAAATAWRLPEYFCIPDELMQLWQYSASGAMTGKSVREFSYFSPAEVVEFYFTYQFWYYAPQLMPIAFDGGCVFYCYDFRQPAAPPPVIMVPSGAIGADGEEMGQAGGTLVEAVACILAA